MKIAVTARGSTPDSDIDERMGRAYWLMLYETKTNSWQAINNDSGRNALEGAGKKTADPAAKAQAAHVKAKGLLNDAGIDVYLGAAGTVMDTLVLWHDGNMQKARSANNIGSPYCITGKGAS